MADKRDESRFTYYEEFKDADMPEPEDFFAGTRVMDAARSEDADGDEGGRASLYNEEDAGADAYDADASGGHDPEADDDQYADGDEFDEEDLESRISERRKIRGSRRIRNKKITVIVLIVAFALMATMCGKDIVRLKAENRALKKQQIALEKERDELKEELKNTGQQDYIREQARKQLRLLNPGEILFTFEDDE